LRCGGWRAGAGGIGHVPADTPFQKACKPMSKPSLPIVASGVLLASCAASAPVVGQMQKSTETFRGAISGSGYVGGSGELTLSSSRSAECRGRFTYTSRRRGEGVLNCSDGRTGPFHVAAVGEAGNGYGDLNGQRFTFTFGVQ
jgi:hypothetical protein